MTHAIVIIIIVIIIWIYLVTGISSWYFSSTSGDPHHSDFKFHTAVLSVFRWVDNIRMDLQEVGCGYVDWIERVQDRDRWRTLVSAVMNLRVP